MGDGDAAAGGDERLRLDRFVAVAGVQDRRFEALSKRTEPWKRASLLGFNDLLNGATGAGLTLLGGVALTAGASPRSPSEP
jgi:hypothetical protein